MTQAAIDIRGTAEAENEQATATQIVLEQLQTATQIELESIGTLTQEAINLEGTLNAEGTATEIADETQIAQIQEQTRQAETEAAEPTATDTDEPTPTEPVDAQVADPETPDPDEDPTATPELPVQETDDDQPTSGFSTLLFIGAVLLLVLAFIVLLVRSRRRNM